MTSETNTLASWSIAAIGWLLWPYRLANGLALLVHGLGHALALWAVTGNALSWATALEGIPLKQFLTGLLPGSPLPQYGDQPPQIPNRLSSRWRCQLVSVGGIAFNLLGMAVVWWGIYAGQDDFFESGSLTDVLIKSGGVCFLIASLTAMTSLPDILGMLHGKTPHWACGPAFAIRYRPDPATKSGLPVSDRLNTLVEILAREASTRGGQSGGFSILVEKKGAPSIIFDKVVKGKREDIVRVLMQKLDHLLIKARKEGYSRPASFEAILLHLRYATGGATHWHNAQPHWYEHYDAMIHHRPVSGKLGLEEKEVFNMIAHNGDMDGVYLDVMLEGQRVRQFFTQPEARSYFVTAMPWSSSRGNSDSRSIAEWVDFHLTQGLAFKALRFAWFSSVLDFNRDIASGNFDTSKLLIWSETIDQTMIRIRKTLGDEALTPGAHSIGQMSDKARSILRSELVQQFDNHLDPVTSRRLLVAFEEAFFEHDLTWLMRRASRDMVGEFALMVCSTLEPRMGVFSLTQAFSIGHNRTTGEILGSAEPLGVTTSLHLGEENDEAHQIYLEDGQYATIEFEPEPEQDPIRIFDRASPKDRLLSRAAPNPKTLIGTGKASPQCSWFPVNHNPKIVRTRPTSPQEKPIAKDLREIPYVLQQIVRSFLPGGENHSTVTRLGNLLFTNLLDPGRDPHQHDLVLYGVDFNQDLVNEFALALNSILPSLRVRAENSGNVLKEMKRTRREGIGNYGSKTVFIGVSNSAQTQSTLAVIRQARDLFGPQRCFVISQSVFNSMSEAIGQGYQPHDAILPNTFVNLSHCSPDGGRGRRRAEAATIVPVATQAVLTEILMYLTERAITEFSQLDQATIDARSEHFELRQDLNMTDVEAFREFQDAVYGVDIPNRVGFNPDGEAIQSPDHAPMAREARARAENQVEFVRSYAIFAAYIIIATVFGVPVFAVMLSPLSFVPGLNVIAHLLDATLFLSALWLIHLGIRKAQGRPVFERIGARAEVFIDRKYIARMIERYNATLFSNAPGFITPFFYWADTIQDALHRYGIRAHRGVVTIHRSPDERMGIEEANNAAEENMVHAQLGGIRFNGGQPQSRDKVRTGSCYVNPARACQTILSDSLTGLRAKYDKKLSSEMFRLINRRLIDLADGLITEFAIGYQRREIVNQSIWEVIRWAPGAAALYEVLLRNDIDLRNLAGDADTANQAQIQSTKHPVSPMDIHIQTMTPRSTFDALRGETQAVSEPFAVLAFSGDTIGITLNQSAQSFFKHSFARELRLKQGRGQECGKLVSEPVAEGGRFTGFVVQEGEEDCLVIENPVLDFRVSLPISGLEESQRRFLDRRLTTAVQINLEAA